MRALLLRNENIVNPDGSKIQIVVWELPFPTIDRPHGFKYRLNYCGANGTTTVRYDNKKGKGDHKHIGSIEVPYEFRSVDELVMDFLADIASVGGE
jgi:hypothetical protein